MEFHYWHTSSGREVDFIINDKEIVIEVKTSSRIFGAHVKNHMAVAEDGPVGQPLEDEKDALDTASFLIARDKERKSRKRCK